MKNNKGYTLVEVLVSFTLISIVMIYLLNTIVVLSRKNNELLVEQEYEVFETTFLDKLYKDIDTVGKNDSLELEVVNNNITFTSINKTLSFDKDNNSIIYDGIIYELPKTIKFDNPMYEYKIEDDYTLITIKLKTDTEDKKLKIFYQKNRIPIAYNVTFYPRNGERPYIKGVAKGSELSNIPEPLKAGYTFKYWSLDAGGGYRRV